MMSPERTLWKATHLCVPAPGNVQRGNRYVVVEDVDPSMNESLVRDRGDVGVRPGKDGYGIAFGGDGIRDSTVPARREACGDRRTGRFAVLAEDRDVGLVRRDRVRQRLGAMAPTVADVPGKNAHVALWFRVRLYFTDRAGCNDAKGSPTVIRGYRCQR